MMLHTQRDREIHRLRNQIEEHVRWLRVDAGDRRAIAWHQARITELWRELTELEERD
jgi:predicted RNase H-like nuclease (RuvC/YqgF family)